MADEAIEPQDEQPQPEGTLSERSLIYDLERQVEQLTSKQGDDIRKVENDHSAAFGEVRKTFADAARDVVDIERRLKALESRKRWQFWK